MNDDYRPIACDVHDLFEIAIMRKETMQIQMLEECEWVTRTIIPVDTTTEDGAEFLVYQAEGDEARSEVRLDHIRPV